MSETLGHEACARCDGYIHGEHTCTDKRPWPVNCICFWRPGSDGCDICNPPKRVRMKRVGWMMRGFQTCWTKREYCIDPKRAYPVYARKDDL